jgi:hypothetical protein
MTRRLRIQNEWVTAIVVKNSYGEGSSLYFKGPHHIIELMLGQKSGLNATEAEKFQQ